MTDCSSETPTVQMTMFEDNIFKAAQDRAFCDTSKWSWFLYKDNQCIIQDPICVGTLRYSSQRKIHC